MTDHENNDRTHPDSGSRRHDREARRWELYCRVVAGLAEYGVRMQSTDEAICENALSLTDAALVAYEGARND